MSQIAELAGFHRDLIIKIRELVDSWRDQERDGTLNSLEARAAMIQLDPFLRKAFRDLSGTEAGTLAHNVRTYLDWAIHYLSLRPCTQSNRNDTTVMPWLDRASELLHQVEKRIERLISLPPQSGTTTKPPTLESVEAVPATPAGPVQGNLPTVAAVSHKLSELIAQYPEGLGWNTDPSTAGDLRQLAGSLDSVRGVLQGDAQLLVTSARSAMIRAATHIGSSNRSDPPKVRNREIQSDTAGSLAAANDGRAHQLVSAEVREAWLELSMAETMMRPEHPPLQPATLRHRERATLAAEALAQIKGQLECPTAEWLVNASEARGRLLGLQQALATAAEASPTERAKESLSLAAQSLGRSMHYMADEGDLSQLTHPDGVSRRYFETAIAATLIALEQYLSTTADRLVQLTRRLPASTQIVPTTHRFI